MLVLTNLYIFVLATILAILEIQIEGENGWAKNLPTWRPDPNHPIAKLYSKMMSGKPLTGYHAALFPFILLIFHLTFFLGTPFTLQNELHVLSLYMIYITLEDFLWFVLNPFHPLKNFIKGNVNHRKFFLGMPVDYYYALVVSLIFAIFGGFVGWWLINISLFIVETLITILFSIYILDIDNWSQK